MTLVSGDGQEKQTGIADPDRRSLGFPARPRFGTVSQRYSRFVGAMKIFLPALAVILVIAVLSWPSKFDQPEMFQLSFGAEPGRADDDLSMLKPRYIGTDSNGRPFAITAASATQDAKDQRRITLTTLQADMTMHDGSWITLMAASGIYHQSRQHLELRGPVSVFSDLGYEFHALSAQVDLAAGSAVSERPVSGQGPFGRLSADSVRLTENGQRMRFEGNVKVVVFPETNG